MVRILALLASEKLVESSGILMPIIKFG